MESALASASAISDQRQKIEQYKHILTTVLASNDIVQAKKFTDHSQLLTFTCCYSSFLIVSFSFYNSRAWFYSNAVFSFIRWSTASSVKAAFADFCAGVRKIGARDSKGDSALYS